MPLNGSILELQNRGSINRSPLYFCPHRYVLCDRYIPYALGGGYVLSANLVGFLADNAAALRPYRAEDASVGTWLAPLKIHR